MTRLRYVESNFAPPAQDAALIASLHETSHEALQEELRGLCRDEWAKSRSGIIATVFLVMIAAGFAIAVSMTPKSSPNMILLIVGLFISSLSAFSFMLGLASLYDAQAKRRRWFAAAKAKADHDWAWAVADAKRKAAVAAGKSGTSPRRP